MAKLNYSLGTTAARKVGAGNANAKSTTHWWNLSFYPVLYLLLALGTINFMLTGNPSAANMGGYDKINHVTSNWFIGWNVIFSICYVIGLILLRPIKVHTVIKYAIGGMLLSGVITGIFFQRAQTYILDSMGLVFLCSLAYKDAKFGLANNNFESRAKTICYILVVVGFVLAFASIKYGKVEIAFSRSSRTNITLWNVLGLDAMLLPLIFSQLIEKKRAPWLDVFVVLFFTIVITTTYRRTWMLEIYSAGLIFLVVYAIRHRSTAVKWFLGIFTAVFLINIQTIIGIFLLATDSDVDVSSTLNGRDQLWPYYYDKFLESPIWGQGSFLLERATDYTSTATSEIGFLKWFTEYGLMYAIPIAIILGLACYRTPKILLKIPENTRDKRHFVFCAFVVAANTPIFLTNSVYRTMSIEGSIYWYCVMYICWRYVLDRKEKRARELRQGMPQRRVARPTPVATSEEIIEGSST